MCSFPFCNSVEFQTEAAMPGVYKLKVDFLGNTLVIEQEFGLGDQLIFPIDKLNENYEYTSEIIDPLGDKVTITESPYEYDCFKFRTVMSKTLVEVEVESS